MSLIKTFLSQKYIVIWSMHDLDMSSHESTLLKYSWFRCVFYMNQHFLSIDDLDMS